MAREELKTIEGWHKSGCNSWDEYCKPGDMVDQGVADYFLDILPPRIMTRDYFQVGEPHSHAINPKTMKYCGTYATFAVRGKGGRCVMKRTERTVNVKAWGCLGAKRVVLYEDRDELRFTDGFHDMRMTQARMEAFVPGGDAVLADVYRRVRGTRSWHPVVKELKKLLDEIGEKRYED